MNTSRLVSFVALAASGLVVLAPGPASAQALEVDLEARMHTTAVAPNLRGHADYESDQLGRSFEVSLAGIRSLSGRHLVVRVHGDFVGRMTVGPRGHAHLERHTGVPRSTAGDVVRVRTRSGLLVTRGVLRVDVEDHD